MASKITMSNGWDKISESYQKRYSIGTSKIHWGPLCPSEDKLKLLGNLPGKRIIEIGSGAGQNSIVLAKKKAILTAFDVSKKQLGYGKQLAKKEGVKISFVKGNFEKIRNFFEPGSFDIAFSVYALQYCKTLDSMNNTFKQIYKILNKKGFFVFSIDHPVRAIGHWDHEDNFILNNYFDRSQKRWDYRFPETGVSATMQGSFKTISDITNGVIDAGFKLEKILEPEPIKYDLNTQFGIKSSHGYKAKIDPYSFNHLSRIPGTIIIKAVK